MQIARVYANQDNQTFSQEFRFMKQCKLTLKLPSVQSLTSESGNWGDCCKRLCKGRVKPISILTKNAKTNQTQHEQENITNMTAFLKDVNMNTFCHSCFFWWSFLNLTIDFKRVWRVNNLISIIYFMTMLNHTNIHGTKIRYKLEFLSIWDRFWTVFLMDICVKFACYLHVFRWEFPRYHIRAHLFCHALEWAIAKISKLTSIKILILSWQFP